MDHGFFYLTNHGVSVELMERVFTESKNLFSLPLDDKIVMSRRGLRGYSPLHDEKFSTTAQGTSYESSNDLDLVISIIALVEKKEKRKCVILT